MREHGTREDDGKPIPVLHPEYGCSVTSTCLHITGDNLTGKAIDSSRLGGRSSASDAISTPLPSSYLFILTLGTCFYSGDTH